MFCWSVFFVSPKKSYSCCFLQLCLSFWRFVLSGQVTMESFQNSSGQGLLGKPFPQKAWWLWMMRSAASSRASLAEIHDHSGSMDSAKGSLGNRCCRMAFTKKNTEKDQQTKPIPPLCQGIKKMSKYLQINILIHFDSC